MAEEKVNIYAALARAQRSIAAPKAKYNSFAKFNYRSYEDIVKAVKTPCAENGIGFYVSDSIEQVGDRFYVKATATLFSTEDPNAGTIEASAYAREALDKKGCDQSQVTGMASSYARKYALCGLFDIDGENDPDSMDNSEHQAVKKDAPKTGEFCAHCRSCGTRYAFKDQDMYNGFVVSLAQQPCCDRPDWVVE